MTRLSILLLTILCYAHAVPTKDLFKVMSFNIWRSGDKVNDGLRKAAEQIKIVGPDVVALQEAQDRPDITDRLVKMLGSEWSGVQHCLPNQIDVKGQAIVTKHDIIGYDHTKAGMNLRIRLKGSGLEISVWSMHLHWKNFGPDNILNGKLSAEEILKGELEQRTYHGRLYNIIELIKHPKFVEQIKNSNNVPVIVAGDFNTPSDQDYTEARAASHNGYAIEFPVTKVLREVAGMRDSYRIFHENTDSYPGVTWPVYNTDRDFPDDLTPRIKDRIDYIFFRGPISVYHSEAYPRITEIVDDKGQAWRNNDYPSDHFAVVTTFVNDPYFPRDEDHPSLAIPSKYAAFDHSYETLPECSLEDRIVH